MEFGTDDYFDNGSGEEVAVIGSASTAGVLGSPSFQQPIKDDADRLQTLSYGCKQMHFIVDINGIN